MGYSGGIDAGPGGEAPGRAGGLKHAKNVDMTRFSAVGLENGVI